MKKKVSIESKQRKAGTGVVTSIFLCITLLTLSFTAHTKPIDAHSANTSYPSSTKLIDLTYPFNRHTIYWPTERGFLLERFHYGTTEKGYFYSAYRYCAPEHGGTHVDAPRHFSQKGLTVDQIPVTALMGKAVVIHVEKNVKNNRDYAIKVDDIKAFEHQHGSLTPENIVLFYTGWGQYWDHKTLYLGTAKFGDVKNLHFPGISQEAAQYLVARKVKAIGLDTPSLDPGISQNFKAHQIILGANLYGIENIAHLELVPITGATLIVAPMKIERGSGAPARVLALIDKKNVS